MILFYTFLSNVVNIIYFSCTFCKKEKILMLGIFDDNWFDIFYLLYWKFKIALQYIIQISTRNKNAKLIGITSKIIKNYL